MTAEPSHRIRYGTVRQGISAVGTEVETSVPAVSIHPSASRGESDGDIGWDRFPASGHSRGRRESVPLQPGLETLRQVKTRIIRSYLRELPPTTLDPR